MKDEIKEILELMQEIVNENQNKFASHKKLIDYITNLQEENEDCKSRIDKAVDYINHSQNYGTMAQVMPHLKPYVNGDDLLNILQGVGKDE